MSKKPRKAKNWLEWTVFGVGLVLVVAILGYLTTSAITIQSGPPRIEVELGPPRQEAGHFAVPVTVANRGHETAEAVHIQITLNKRDGEAEQAEFQVQFLPRGSSRHGTVTFESNPADAGELISRVLGYQRP